jgi:hypothetical protein
MAILPSRFQDFLAFVQNHASTWQANHAEIGVSSAQTTSFTGFVAALEAAYQNQISAKQAQKNATIALNDAASGTRAAASDMLRLIKAFAENSGKPNEVYALADIPPPAAPSPAAPPGQPTTFKASLEAEGFLTMTWKAPNPSGLGGTVWTIRRKLGAEGEWAQVGATGLKRFTDETLPLGAGGGLVQYQVQGQRGQALGLASVPFVVQFGAGSGGGGFRIASQFMADGAGGAGEARGVGGGKKRAA